MKNIICLVVLILSLKPVFAEESVTVPWPEFKELYREKIERDITDKTEKIESVKEVPIATISEAAYSLSITETGARGDVRIEGKIISGPPESIPLFGKEMILSSIDEVTGGHLACSEEGGGGIRLLPEGDQSEFRVALSFLTEVHEENGARTISFSIPIALKNSLQMELSSETQVLEAPGIMNGENAYNFPSQDSLTVRFLDKSTIANAFVDIDTFSRIQIQGKRAILSTTFLPAQRIAGTVDLKMPDRARFVSSSLGASRIKKVEDGLFEISPNSDEGVLFSLSFAIDQDTENANYSFCLPRISRNNGREGDFMLAESVDARISVSGEGMTTQNAIAGLAEGLRRSAGEIRAYSHTPPGQPISIQVTRFQTLSTPPIVLDSIEFITSFEENGNSLSTLIVNVPPEAGTRLKLPMIQEATIWSLRVNKEKKNVYVDSDNSWIIPLSGKSTSRVEIALLRKGEPLGLRGRLEAIMPATNLPSRTVRVGIALPERIQLLSIEGPVSPVSDKSWGPLENFIGKPHFFSRTFHKGEEMKLAVFYKEPVEQK